MFPGWLTGTARRWLALTGTLITLASIVAFAASHHRVWGWLAIGALALLAISLGLTAREEHDERLKAQAQPHQPPGGGIPLGAPVDYQVNALRQIIARVSETQDVLDYQVIYSMLKKLPRTGTDPIYEPLRYVNDGLASLVELGELEQQTPHMWMIVRRTH